MRVAARVGELLEPAPEAAESRVLAFLAYSAHRLGDESEILSQFRARKAKEKSFVAGDDLVDSLERDSLVAEADYVLVRQGLPQVEELGHEAGDLEG